MKKPLIPEIIDKTIVHNGREIFGFHPYYGAWLPEQKLCIPYIPKNISCTLKQIVPLHGISGVDMKVVEEKTEKYCVILRDPKERFLSTINMYLGERPIDNDYVRLGKNSEGHWQIQQTDDIHFLPQAFYLDGLDKNKMDFFWMNKDIIQDINRFYGLDFQQKNINVSHKFVTDANVEYLKDIYRVDYDLINSVNFVNLSKGEK